MDQQYLQNLHACLEQISAPTGGTESIKQATRALNEQFYKSPLAIPGLFHILSTSTNPSVRQLAGVELRKRVSAAKHKHWKKLDVSTRSQIKARLLELVLAEETSLTRHAISRVIAEVAEIELTTKSWPELLQFLLHGSQSLVASQREVVIYTLLSLMDTVVELFAEQLPAIYSMLEKALTDPESLDVRVVTVQTLGKVADYIEHDEDGSIATFQAMVPQIINVTGQTIQANNEEAAKKVFDTIETLLVLETPLLNPHLHQLIEFLVTVGQNQSVEEELRIMALNALLWTVKFKKSKVGQLDVVKPIVTALISIGATDEPDDIDDESIARTAFRTLDALANSLAPQSVFPILFECVQQCSASPDPTLRKSSLMAMGVTIEGCATFVEPHMDKLWPFVDAGLKDPDVRVRKAACSALQMITRDLSEATAKRHGVLMPLVTALLQDQATQRLGMSALDSLLECLDSKVIGVYLHRIMERLVPMLDNSPLELKATIVGAIGSAAFAAKKAFLPYFEGTMQRITPFLSLKEEGHEQDLRAVTQDQLGTLAQAVGKENFAPYLDASLQVAFEATALDSPQLRECSMIFFGELAKVFKEDFAQYLPRLMPMVLASLGQMDEEEASAEVTISEKAGKGFAAEDDDDDEGDRHFVDVDDLDDDDDIFKVTTAIALEKAVAADAVLDIFEWTKSAFLPFLESTVKSVSPLMEHFYPGTRQAAATTLIGMISVLHEIRGGGAELSTDVQNLIQMVIPGLLTVWESDDDSDVVANICAAFSQCIESVGATVVAPHLERICTYLHSILERKALCQQDSDLADEAEVKGVLSESESTLIDSASHLVGSLATAVGANFLQACQEFMPLIIKFCDASYSPSDRENAVGALAEIVNGLQLAITPFTEQLLQVGLAAIMDPDVSVQSNAAFLLGSLVFHSGQDLSSHYMTVLGRLQPLFTLKEGSLLEKSETARDNAAGAVARMILKNKAALPLDQVLPVYFDALPLLRDFSENAKCFEAVFVLFQEQHPLVQVQFGHLLDVFAATLKPVDEAEDERLTEGTKAQLVELLRALNSQAPAELAARGLNQYL